jgi:putative transposase
MAAAKAFLRSARSVTQVEPEQVTTDGHTSYPKAIADELDTDVDHRTSQYKNNHLEIDQTWCLFKSKCFREWEDTDELRFGMCFGELSIDRVQRHRQRSATSAYQHSCRAFL